jgi:serine/threonine-protein phosphatase 5
VIHGGLFSDQQTTLESRNRLHHFCEPPADSGPLNDLLWSEPMNEEGFTQSPHGVTTTVGPDVTKKFLAENRLELLIRSHQVPEEGSAARTTGNPSPFFRCQTTVVKWATKGQ